MAIRAGAGPWRSGSNKHPATGRRGFGREKQIDFGLDRQLALAAVIVNQFEKAGVTACRNPAAAASRWAVADT